MLESDMLELEYKLRAADSTLKLVRSLDQEGVPEHYFINALNREGWYTLGVLFPQERFATFSSKFVLDQLKIRLEKELQKLGYELGKCYDMTAERGYLEVLRGRGSKQSER